MLSNIGSIEGAKSSIFMHYINLPIGASICTNGHKNKDISGAGMKDNMPSPN